MKQIVVSSFSEWKQKGKQKTENHKLLFQVVSGGEDWIKIEASWYEEASRQDSGME